MSAATRNLGPCLVCGHKAIGINFSVATCAPCKAFFRRNAVKLGTIEFNCQKDGDCPVVYNSRRMCNCCRLAKCFRVGMQKSLIRTESEKESRKEIVQQTRQRRAVLNQTFTHDPIRPSNLLCLSQSHSRQLSIEDQILLTNIFSAYERTCIVTRITHAPYYPSKPYSSIHTCLNEYTVRQRSLIEYFKLIPEFNSFTMDDKVRLIRNHFGSMFGINERICNDVISENAKLTIRNLFETDLANDFIHSIYLMSAYASDPMFLELVLVVRTLSSGFNRYHHDPDIDRIYDNTLKIFASQNIYVELLWRYLLSRLPSEQNAIKFFNKFILDLLFLQRTYIRLGCHIYRSKDELNRLHPLMQSMWPLNKQSVQTNGNDHVMKSWL